MYDYDSAAEHFSIKYRLRKARELVQHVDCGVAVNEDEVHFTDIWNATKETSRHG